MSGITRVPVCHDCLVSPEPFVAEVFCSACGTPFLNRHPLDENGLCALCRSGLHGFDTAYCYGAYEGALRKLIHLFKYGRMTPLARPLAALMALALPRERQFDAVVPVPLHWRKKWQRGFNQSELLARLIARRCGVPVVDAVKRRKGTEVQAGLSNSKRRLNVAGAFSPRSADLLTGKRVLLIDDVMTTGATASACARAVKAAGARSVTLLALARVDRRFVKVLDSKRSLTLGGTA